MASYLKFFGSDKARELRSYSIKDEIKRAESHFVAGFSRRRPPTGFHKNDIVFMGRMVKEPNDYVIFGKGIVADEFKLPRDQATQKDVERIEFRKVWPYYLRLRDTKFIDGSMRNGIEIEELILKFGYNSFVRTRQWHENGKINFGMRSVFANQSYVELTNESSAWLNILFESKMENFGKVDAEFLKMLPKPEWGF